MRAEHTQSMTAPDSSKNEKKTKPGIFEPGGPGGPGRPEGSRNRATLILDQIAGSKAKEIMARVVQAAEGGDMRACELLLSRMWPPRKGSLRAYPIRSVESAADISAALGDVLRAVASGEMTGEEGATLAAIIETQRKAIEIVELEARIAALEAQRK